VPSKKAPMPTVLDLFSGAGGLSLGFEMAGFHVHTAVDNWPDALRTLAFNSPSTTTVQLDLGESKAVESLCRSLPKIDVVVGGPPCQGFSIAGKRDPQDPRNKLYKGFVSAIKILKPSSFVMENVPTIASPSNRELFEAIIKDFRSLGYKVSTKVLLASEHGVPQNRKRMFIVGVLEKFKSDFRFPEPTKTFVTCAEAISDLPCGSIVDGSRYPSTPSTFYQRKMRSGSRNLYNHDITNHTEQTIKLISMVPDGGNHKDLPREFQGIRNVNIAWTRFASWKPSPTIDTGHRHHFHYQYDRVPTARESARLQSFPDRYIFLGGKTSQLKQIGNAVPPLLAFSLAGSLSNFLENEK
jgi:DNA (cytosine-5)-methyltransferase 1